MAYKPLFAPSPKLLTLLQEIAALSTRIQSAAIGVAWIPSLQRDTVARIAHSTTAIEGNPLTLPEVKILAEGGKLPHARPKTVQDILNTFAVLRYIQKLGRAQTLLERDVLKLHRIIGQRDVLDRGPVGAYRTYQVWVGHHQPPAAREVRRLMGDLLNWLNGPGQAWPPVVSSAILHFRFEDIHPFGDGNGRTGRALAVWELYRRGFDTHHIFAVDELFWENRPAYYKALQGVRDAKSDLSGWAEFVATAVKEALDRAWRRMENLRASQSDQPITLTPKQERLLTLLGSAAMGIREIQAALKLSRQGAHFLMKPLIERDLIVRRGGVKTGKYFLV